MRILEKVVLLAIPFEFILEVTCIVWFGLIRHVSLIISLVEHFRVNKFRLEIIGLLCRKQGLLQDILSGIKPIGFIWRHICQLVIKLLRHLEGAILASEGLSISF